MSCLEQAAKFFRRDERDVVGSAAMNDDRLSRISGLVEKRLEVGTSVGVGRFDSHGDLRALSTGTLYQIFQPRPRDGLTFFHSAATCLHVPGAQNKHFKRSPAGSAGGPANGTWSAAVKSYAAGHCMCSLNRCR